MTLSKTEKKHLVYLHIKRDGLTYQEACKRVEKDLKFMEKTEKDKREAKKKQKNSKIEFKYPNSEA